MELKVNSLVEKAMFKSNCTTLGSNQSIGKDFFKPISH